MKKTGLFFVTAMLFLMAVLCTAVCAAENTEYVIDDFEEEQNWVAGKNISGMRLLHHEPVSDADFAYGYLNIRSNPLYPNEDCAILYDLGGESYLNLYDYKKLTFRVNFSTVGGIIPAEEEAESKKTEYTLTLILYSESDTFEKQLTVPGDSWCRITVDISEYAGRSSICAMSLSVSRNKRGDDLDNQELRQQINISSFHAVEKADTTLAEKFLTPSPTVSGGQMMYTKNGIRMDFDGTDVPYIQGGILLQQPEAISVYDTVRIVLENRSACDSLTIFFGSEDEINLGYAPEYSCEIAWTEENKTEVYYMDIEEFSALPGIFRLMFNGASSGSVVVHSIAFLDIDDGQVEDVEYVGKISECTYVQKADYAAYFGDISGLYRKEEDTIAIKGSLLSDAAANYYGGKLKVYALPFDVDPEVILNGGEGAILVAERDISTRFEIKIPVPDNPTKYLYAACRFVVLAEKDGMQEFVCPPICYSPYSADAEAENRALCGIDNSSSAYLAGGGYDCIIIDVYCSRLIDNSDGKLYASGDRYYYFNTAYLSELDSLIKIYSGTGTDVILRLLNENTEALYNAFDASEESRSRLAAIADFLSVRYSGAENQQHGKIAGFILGTRINTLVYNYDPTAIFTDGSSLMTYAESYAMSLRLLYNIASLSIPDITVYASLGDGIIASGDMPYIDPNMYYLTAPQNDITGISAYNVDPVLMLAVLCRVMPGTSFDWKVIYEFSDADGVRIEEFEKFLEYSETDPTFLPPKAAAFLWRPDKSQQYSAEQIAQVYAKIYEELSAYPYAHLSVLSLSGLSDINATMETIYDALKVVGTTETKTEGNGTPKYLIFLSAPGESRITGRYLCWDFRYAYDSQGWFAGEGCLSLSTVKSSMSGKDQDYGKSLRAVFENARVGGASILRVMEDPYDFAVTPIVDFHMAISAGDRTEGTVPVTVIFGCGANRAEYTEAIPYGTDTVLTVDLRTVPFAATIDYIAVVVDTEEKSTFELISVTGCSETMNSEELEETINALVDSREAADDDVLTEADKIKRFVILVFVFVFTVFWLSLLSRKREE